MPSEKKNCPFCAKTMYSHNLKPHIKKHLSVLEADPVPGWMKHPTRNMWVSVQKSTVEGLPSPLAADKHKYGVCGDCCLTITKSQHYKASSLTPFDLHVCREQIFRGTRKPKGDDSTENTATSTATTTTTKSAANYQEMFAECRKSIMNTGIRLKGEEKEAMGKFKQSLLETFKSVEESNDDGDGEIDWKQALMDLTSTMAMDLFRAKQAAASPASPNPPAPAPASLNPPAPNPPASDPVRPKPLMTIGYTVEA